MQSNSRKRKRDDNKGNASKIIKKNIIKETEKKLEDNEALEGSELEKKFQSRFEDLDLLYSPTERMANKLEATSINSFTSTVSIPKQPENFKINAPISPLLSNNLFVENNNNLSSPDVSTNKPETKVKENNDPQNDDFSYGYFE